MIKNLTKSETDIIDSHRIARLATVDELGKPTVVPICFALHGNNIYSPIDKKPKKVQADKLKRLRNIDSNSNVSIVIDKYSEDWAELYYIIIQGEATVLENGAEYHESLKLLAAKYSQYREMGLMTLGLPVIKIVPKKIISWGIDNFS